MSKTNLIAQYSQLLLETFSSLIPKHRPLARIGFPDHANCGDHAIWLGETLLLDKLGFKTAYECSSRSYDRTQMAEKLGNGVILMHGGGNFGDHWREHQDFRLLVLQDFPRNKVIVFPQTSGFLDNAYLHHCANVFGKHPDVTICARDAMSYHVMNRYFGAHAAIKLLPDMAFLIGPMKWPGKTHYDVVWISRLDKERLEEPPALAETGLEKEPVRVFAFPRFQDDIAMNVAAKYRAPDIFLTDWLLTSFANDAAKDSFSRLSFLDQSKMYVDRAKFILGQGRVVITDRLHGHILCILMGKQHIFLNNNYGKNWNFYNTWTRDTPLCRLAQSPAEAWAMAREHDPAVMG